MVRDAHVSVYVEQEIKDCLKREANARGLSVSEYAANLLDRTLANEAQEELGETAEDRLLEIVQTATDEISQTERATREMQAKMGVYAIANWELLKQDVPDGRRTEVLQIAADRLRKPIDEQDVDESVGDGDGGSDDDGSSGIFDRIGGSS